MAFNWLEWQFTRDADTIDAGKPPWWMDRRHIEFLYDFAMLGGFKRILEIGVHHGSSTSALVQAINDGAAFDLHTVDPAATSVFVDVIGRCRRPISHHATCSLRVLSSQAWDFVIVDGNHSLEQVSKELGLLLACETPTILAHDVEYRSSQSTAGSVMLGEVLQKHPAYLCRIDAESRPSEWTDRGLLVATRKPELHEAAAGAWSQMLAKPIAAS